MRKGCFVLLAFLWLLVPELSAQNPLSELIKRYTASGDTSLLHEAFLLTRQKIADKNQQPFCYTESMGAIQARLLEKEAWIEYYDHDSSWVVFAIKPNHRMVKEIRRTPQSDSLITRFMSLLTTGRKEHQFVPEPEEIRQFTNLGFQLYQILLAPVMPVLRKRRSITEPPPLQESQPRLIIRPDGGLSALPFELLLDQPPVDRANQSWGALPYLFRTWPVQYLPVSDCETVLDTIVMLWTATPKISRDFNRLWHDMRAEGHTEVLSLQMAREYYLDLPSYEHPYYWGSFRLMSTEWELEEASNSAFWGLMLGLTVLITLIAIRIFRA